MLLASVLALQFQVVFDEVGLLLGHDEIAR